MLNGKIKTDHWNFTPAKIAKAKTTKRLIESEIKALTIEEIITIYFGKLIFRIKSPRATIEFIPKVTASVKNPQRERPRSRVIA